MNSEEKKNGNYKTSTEASVLVQTQMMPKGTDVTRLKEQNEHFFYLWE